jgi:hypothetical protein
VVGALQNPELPATFFQNQINLRRVFALLAVHPSEPAQGADLVSSLLPLAVFHLQETGPDNRQRAAALLSAGLQQPEINKHLQTLPDNVLTYLRDAICQDQPSLSAPSHWIDAELSRRKNAYRLEIAAKAASPHRGSIQPPEKASDTGAPIQPVRAIPAGSATRPPGMKAAPGPNGATISKTRANSTPAPPPPSSKSAKAGASGQPEATPASTSASQAAPAPLLGQIALPGAARKKSDSAIWLWIAIVVIGILALAIVIGALVFVQSLH